MNTTQHRSDRITRAQAVKRRLDITNQLREDYRSMARVADKRAMSLTIEMLEILAGVR